MTRAELASLCEEEVNKLKEMVRGCLEAADAAENGSLSGVQAAGGGCRMPLVQAAVRAEVWTVNETLADVCCSSYSIVTVLSARSRRCEIVVIIIYLQFCFTLLGVRTSFLDPVLRVLPVRVLDGSRPVCCRWMNRFHRLSC